MVNLVSDTEITCQYLDLLLSLVREIIFMSWKVVLLVIIDVKSLNMYDLLPTCLVLLQIELRITIILIMTMNYEGNLISF